MNQGQLDMPRAREKAPQVTDLIFAGCLVEMIYHQHVDHRLRTLQPEAELFRDGGDN